MFCLWELIGTFYFALFDNLIMKGVVQMYDAYGRYFPNQQPQYNAYQPQLQKSEIVHVNGKGGAEAYAMAPNSNILLLDDTQPIIWLKQTDGAGYPNLTPYTITPYQPEPQISNSDLMKRIEALEAKLNESHTKPTNTK